MNILVIGDCTEDTFLSLSPSDVGLHCDLDTEQCQICFGYAQKIPVKEVVRAVGGNAANVAVGLTRLGHRVALYSQVGDDSAGQTVLSTLADEGVDTTFIAAADKEETNNSVIINYHGERTIFSYHYPRQYSDHLPDFQADIIYLTSLGTEFMKTYDEVIHNHTSIVFQPGTYQIRAGLKRLRPVLQRTSLLILNKDEATALVGQKDDPLELLNALLDNGPKEVVITDGAAGAYMGGEEFFWVGIDERSVRREMTGVGDAFASGYLHGRFALQLSTVEAAQLGALNAGSVVAETGAQKGLLTSGRLQQKLSTVRIKSNRL